ncbi:MFS transporter [Paraburkholderia guartelaensis]|uniref:MFS transporter n=1 Tax=Paraburkholderia guartelaensis TaxID=2546446 RepID=UPI002AB70B74|nr:MFS transporter [Paraburkholderia guartelaensis]
MSLSHMREHLTNGKGAPPTFGRELKDATMNDQPSPEAAGKELHLHPDVLSLGLVSFLTDLSSEMIFSVFALFFTTIAGASAALLGMVEGFGDLFASSLNYLAGWMADRTGKRKALTLAGYGFSTLAKIILPITSSVAGLSAFRVVERLGKGFRGPPRDAWISAVADKGNRGYAFGVHKALDKAGAVLGPLVAYGLLAWLGERASTYRILFWTALAPALLSLVVLSFIKDQSGVQHRRENMFETWDTLSPGFKRYLVAAGIFSLAYFSFGFLLLRARSAGFSVRDIVLLYALFNASFVAASPLTGKLGDAVGRARLIMLSYLIYLLMSLGFAFATRQSQIIILFIIYGVFFAIDEAQSKAFIADIERERRASAIGLYNFVTGLLYLPASLIAGALWQIRPANAFLVAACLSLTALAVLVFLWSDQKHDSAKPQ